MNEQLQVSHFLGSAIFWHRPTFEIYNTSRCRWSVPLSRRSTLGTGYRIPMFAASPVKSVVGNRLLFNESLNQPAKDGDRTQAHNTVGAIGYACQRPTRNVTGTSNVPTPGEARPRPGHLIVGRPNLRLRGL